MKPCLVHTLVKSQAGFFHAYFDIKIRSVEAVTETVVVEVIVGRMVLRLIHLIKHVKSMIIPRQLVGQ